MRYLIERENRIHFESPVREHHVQLRLAPWEDQWQRVHACNLTVDPPADPASHLDGFGNLVHRFALLNAHDHLHTRLRAEVETLLANPFDFEPVPPGRERAWIAESLREAPRLWDFVVHRGPCTPALPDTIAGLPVPVPEPDVPLLDQVQEALRWVQNFCDLDPECEDPAPSLDSFLQARRGGPADLAHLLIAVLRGWGVPALYAVGYVDPGYFKPDDRSGVDAEPIPQAMRPWTEVLIPGAGWRGFDPSTGLLADETYVRVAVGRDARDVLAERAVFKGEAQAPETEVTLTVAPLA